MEITHSLGYIFNAGGRFSLQVPSDFNGSCIVQSLCTTLKNFLSLRGAIKTIKKKSWDVEAPPSF